MTIKIKQHLNTPLMKTNTGAYKVKIITSYFLRLIWCEYDDVIITSEDTPNNELGHFL
jgi:hypothetical protein